MPSLHARRAVALRLRIVAKIFCEVPRGRRVGGLRGRWQAVGAAWACHPVHAQQRGGLIILIRGLPGGGRTCKEGQVFLGDTWALPLEEHRVRELSYRALPGGNAVVGGAGVLSHIHGW